MTIDETALKAELQAEYDDANDPKHYKSRTRYVVKRIESEYKQREYTVVPKTADASLYAVKEIQDVLLNGAPVSGSGALFEGHIREDVQIAYASKVEIRSQQKLALIMDYGKKATFKYLAGGDRITVTMTDTVFPKVAVGQYLKATVRGQDPVTKGVRSVTKISNDDQSTYCKFEAKVDEKVIQASTNGGTLAYEPGVEWEIQSGKGATIDYQTTSIGPVLTLFEAQFSLKVKAGDFIHVTGTGEGYYRVNEVGEDQLRLSKEAYTRQSEGVYIKGAELTVNFSGSCDFKVVRTILEPVYLRHTTKTFQGVQAGDWVRTSYTANGVTQYAVWKVKLIPAPGLLILDYDMYTGSQAPYTLNNQIQAGNHFSYTATYGIYRAPENLMAIFRITDTKANFSAFVQPGDYVTLVNRTSGLDQTQNPAKVPGTYRVASVPSASVINLENVRYDLVDGAFVANGHFYDNLTDVASYEIRRYLVLYPYAALYKVMGVDAATKLIELEPNTYSGYGGYAGDYRLDSTTLPPFEDIMDFEVLSTFEDKLFLVDKNADFNAKLANGDFVHLIRRTVYPATMSPDTTGIFKVEEIPLKTVVFLDRKRYQGTEPFYQDTGSTLDLNNYRDDCDYRATRVFANEYSRILLTDKNPLLAGALPGDFLTVSGANATTLMKGTWVVEQRLSDYQVKLVGTHKVSRVGDLYQPDDTLTFRHFEAAVDFTLTRYAAKTTKLEVRKAGADFSAVQFSTVTNGALDAITDIVKVSYSVNGSKRDQIFAVIGVMDGKLALFPTLVTGSGGKYKLSTTELAENFDETASFEVIRAVSDLDDVLKELDLIRQVIPMAEISKLDRGYDAILPKGDRYAQASLSAVRTVCDQLSTGDAVLDQAIPVYGRADLLKPSDAKAALPVSMDDLITMLKLVVFQQGMAISCAIEFTDLYVPKKLGELKDLWIDATLREKGFKLLINEASSKAMPIKDKAILVAGWSAGLAISTKIKASVEDAIRKRNRADIITSINAQLDNFMELVLQGSLDHRIWVQDIKLSLPLGVGLLLPGIDSPEASAKRKAIQGKIGVPADRSVRSIRRSFATKRNRRRFYEKNIDDLSRHRDTATDPGLVKLLDDWITGITVRKDVEIASETTDLNELALRSTELSEINLTPINDLNAVGERLQDVNPTASTGAPGESFQVAAAIVSPGVVSDVLPGAVISSVTPSPTQMLSTSGNITNLFDKDFHDFRRTGIVMPMHVLNQGSSESNRGLLASIQITGSDGVPQAVSFDLGEAGTHSGSEYNHFVLTGVQERHTEKYQVTDTLSDGWVAFAFGAQPEVWSITGLLMNDLYSDQLSRFRMLYEEYLRIGQLSKRNQKMQIIIPAAGIAVWGYAVDFVPVVEASQNESVVPFTLQFLMSGWKPMPMFRYIESNTQVKELPKKLTKGGPMSSLLANRNVSHQQEAAPSSPLATPASVNRPAVQSNAEARREQARRLMDPAARINSTRS